MSSLRSFTVFQDVPTTDVPNPKSAAAAVAPITSPTLSSKSVNINHATTLTTAEKENVHPLTGQRAGPSSNPKKRKTSVLATKVHLPLATKKQKESKEPSEPNPDAKKRKSSTALPAKGKAAVKKDGRTSASSKKAVKKLSRRVSPLPKVDEEEAERERERITQAEIDSRCYELTVKPLADLSQAYEQGASLETPAEEKVKFRSVKESSVEPEIRDYFSSLPQSSALPSASGAAPVEGRAFSTPERKQIYAAFTFTSPSPSAQRFNKATRATSVPRLELV
ncbi:hypothetical protein DXG03_003634 [Asterophora parasitica]|uniref:Uncharacterized protein n=1 Tax=Asterophora parasitica TaxID=117018 RepID=A0A9P7G328_9AGAR|nr:hypothetical protein DXG03_003634 [Asterophora parasitica]